MTTKAIAAGLRALLEGVFDYAGLFPPARLDMAETVRNYARYLDDEHAWMLGRFIVPTARLAPLAGCIPQGDQMPLSVLPEQGQTTIPAVRNDPLAIGAK